jgi:invasion protein IalB
MTSIPMSSSPSAAPERARTCAARSAAWLAAGVLLAAFGLAPPGAVAQQSQEAPATGAAPGAQEAPAAPGGQEAPGTQEAPPVGAQTPPAGQDMTERKFQDWLLRCGPTQQGREVCEMQQQTNDKEGRTIMAVAVGTVPGRSDVGLLIILPLGIALPAGVQLAIDGGAEMPLELDRCERQGCRIEMLIEPDLLTRLKAGREAKVFFEADDPEGQRRRLGVPLSLLGFSAALAELTG